MKPTVVVVSFCNDTAADVVRQIRESGRANARAIDAARWDMTPESDAHGHNFVPSGDERDDAFAEAMEAAGLKAYAGSLEPDTGEPAPDAPPVVTVIADAPVVTPAPKVAKATKAAAPKAE